MNKLQLWLLRKLIRRWLWDFTTGRPLMPILWEETRRRYYEDNIHTRYQYLLDHIWDEYQAELQELEAEYGNQKTSKSA